MSAPYILSGHTLAPAIREAGRCFDLYRRDPRGRPGDPVLFFAPGVTEAERRTFAVAPLLLDLLALALPYVEEAADDAANKPASVRALARRMRDAIERAEGKP